ncbi:MAG: hypothetical protein OXC31_00960 [Spirochaetaceae bacterium]|nr:hypothetical protein [Spirochaetaceae bacterium]
MRESRIPPDVALKLANLRDRMEEHFNAAEWRALGDFTGLPEIVEGHPRLLRSLVFGDDDYPSAVHDVLRSMYRRDAQVAEVIEQFLNSRFPDDLTRHVSSAPGGARITIAPQVFKYPTEIRVDEMLVSVMMPFDSKFDGVLEAIRRACDSVGLKCQRADDIWEDSTIIQDIFSLLFRSTVVVVDFTEKNANVMYETGIAHTLGRTVIPITQSIQDIPSDMRHHRALEYLRNTEGLAKLELDLARRIGDVAPAQPTSGPQIVREFDDDIPF